MYPCFPTMDLVRFVQGQFHVVETVAGMEAPETAAEVLAPEAVAEVQAQAPFTLFVFNGYRHMPPTPKMIKMTNM